MSLHDDFDALARQKLEERAFPFDADAWHSAQQHLAARRKQRKGAWYLLGLIPLAFIAWLLWPRHELSTGSTAAIADGAGSALPEAAMEARKAPDATKLPGHSTASINEVAQPEARLEQAKHQAATAQANPTGTASSAAPIARAWRSSRAPGAPFDRAPASSPPAIAYVPSAAHRAERSSAALLTASAQSAATAEQATIDLSPAASHAEAHGQLDASVRTSDSERNGLEQEEANPQPASPAAAEAAAPPPAATDAPRLAPRAPADSAASAVLAPPAPPLIAARSPWEITVLGGLQRATSRYASDRLSGIASAPGPSPAFGAEIVRLGRNVGIGIGLHHAAYHDRLTLPEQRSMAWEVTRRWFLRSVDTTILFITGTDTVGGQVVHTGINVSTTVQVLASTYDTTAIARIRTARALAVRTSYMELPLLLDGHLVQGRWSLGIRGGPSIGLLTARSGSLPSESGEADAPLRDAAVRQWMVGWTARAYVRYRFNAAWSVGVEPMARGQLIDAIDGPVLTRRSTAVGALLSLGFRLR